MQSFLFKRVVVMAVIAMCCGMSSAQDANRPWGYLTGKNAKYEKAPPLDLRANIASTLDLHLVNPSGQDTEKVDVTISLGEVMIARMFGISLPPDEHKRHEIKVAPPAIVPPSQSPGIYVQDKPNSPLVLKIVVSASANPAQSNTRTQSLGVAAPADFLDVSDARIDGAGKLTVKVKPRRVEDLQGAPCVVKLVLDAAEIPGLLTQEPKGALKVTLTPDNPEAELVCTNVKVAAGTKVRGQISLTVDDVERAVVLEGSFNPQVGAVAERFQLNTTRKPKVTSVRFAKPGDPVVARFEATDASGVTEGTFSISPGTMVERFWGPRKRGASVSLADGSLKVKPEIKDWEFKLDTERLSGAFTLKVVAKTPSSATEYTHDIVFDNTPPLSIKLVARGKQQGIRGTQYTIRTTATDPESKITRMEYYLNSEPPEPGPDGKMSPGPKPIVAQIDPESPVDARTWWATVTLPEKKGKVAFYAVATNGVGMTAKNKFEIEVVDPLRGLVKGQVFYGGVAQGADVKVTLYDKQGKAIKSVNVGADDHYTFKDIQPGDYFLVAEQPTSAKPIYGREEITVDETSAVTVKNITLKK